ncbi:MAG: response regulator [Myxococcota bacterium]|nr:response regulator [Myxococcota bacterium]
MQVDGPSERAPAFLVLEDDVHVGRALRASLAGMSMTAHWVKTCEEARAALSAQRWCGAIFDVGLPDGSGFDLLEELRASHDSLPALMMTGSYDPAIANRAHALRASCVYKPEVTENVLLFAQRSIAARADVHRRMIAAAQELASIHGLTRRETEIVELIARGVSREQLPLALGVSENTLKTMVRRVLVKCRESHVEGVARAVLESVVVLSCAADGE